VRHQRNTYRWRTSIHAVKPPELTERERRILDAIIADRGVNVPKDMLIFEFAFLASLWQADAIEKVNLYIAERRGNVPRCRLCNDPKEDGKLPLCGDCRARCIAAANRVGATLIQETT
jgi:hypothetical protein